MTRPRREPSGITVGRPTVLIALLATILLTSSLLSFASGPSAPAPTGAPGTSEARAPIPPGIALGPTPASESVVPSAGGSTSAPRPALTPATAATLDLYRNVAESGNVLPRYVNGPVGIAYNPVNHLEMVSGSESAAFVLVNPATGIVQNFSQPLVSGTNVGPARQLGGIAFDPLNNETFVADQTYSRILVYDTSSLGVLTYRTAIALASGAGPMGITIDPTNNRVFVADVNTSTVSVIDGATDALITDVAVGDGPTSMAYDPQQDTIYIVNSASSPGNITWMNPNTLSTGGSTFAVPDFPSAIAYSPVGDVIWILEPGHLTAFNSTSRATSVNYTLASSGPTGLYWDGSQNEIYALNAPAGTISAFNMTGVNLTRGVPATNTQKKPALTIATGGVPTLAAGDTALSEVEVLDAASNSLLRVPDSSQTVTGRLPLGAAPGGMAFSPINDAMIVTDTVSNRLLEINSRNVTPGAVPITRGIPIVGHPADVTYDPITGWLVVASNPGTVSAVDPLSGATVASASVGKTYSLWGIVYADNQIWVSASSGFLFAFNATTLVRTQSVQIGSGNPAAPRMMSYDPSNQNLYIALAGDNRVAVVNTTTGHQTASFSAPGTPFGVAVDPVGNQLFVVGMQSSSLLVLDPRTGTLDRTIPLGFLPGWVAYEARSNTAYVSNLRSDTITVVDATYATPPFQVGVGAYPGALGFSPVTGDLFVADAASSTLSVVPIATPSGAPFTAMIAVTPTVTDVGVPVRIAEQGSLPPWALAYSYPILPVGCSSSNVPSLVCYPSTVGPNQTIVASVTNLAGDPVNLTANVNVNPLPHIVNFNVTPAAITLSGSVTLHVDVAGGVPPYKYAYSQVPAGCSAPAAATWSCTPLNPSSAYTVVASVTDAVLYSTTGTTTFVVHLVPQVIVTATPNSTLVGQTVSIEVSVTSGTPGYSYGYTGLPSGCISQNVAVLPCTPRSAGVYAIKVTVIDASNYSRVGQVTLTVNAPSTGLGGATGTTFLLLAIGVVAIVAAIAAVLLWMRRSRPAPPTETGPSEELYGGGTVRPLPRDAVERVAAPGPRAVPPPGAPPPEAEGPSGPAYFPPEDAEPSVMPAPPPATAAKGTRPSVTCAHCGTVNEPWLTNCRYCRRPLAQT